MEIYDKSLEIKSCERCWCSALRIGITTKTTNTRNLEKTKKALLRQIIELSLYDVALYLPDFWTVWKRLQNQLSGALIEKLILPKTHSLVILCVFEYGQVR